MDEEVGEIFLWRHESTCFRNTDLHPDPENKAEVLLYDKDVDGDSKEEEEFSSNKLLVKCEWSLRRYCNFIMIKGFLSMTLLSWLPAEVVMTKFFFALSEYGIPRLKLEALLTIYLQSLEVQGYVGYSSYYP